MRRITETRGGRGARQRRGALAMVLAGLVVGNSWSEAQALEYFWDADGTFVGNQTNGAGLGGTGEWDTLNPRWWGQITVDYPWTNNTITTDDAIFTGAFGTVTLVEPIVARRLYFVSDGYHLQATGGGTLSFFSDGLIAVLQNNTATIDAPIVGNVSLTKGNATINSSNDGGVTNIDGYGTLILGGNNSYTGLTTISRGVLRMTHSNALGSTVGGTVVGAGATLELAGGLAVGAEMLTLNGGGMGGAGALRSKWGDNSWDGDITLNSGARIGVDTDSLTLNGSLGGAGGLTKVGAGDLILSGENNFGGGAAVNAGTLLVNGSVVGGVTVNSGATLGGSGTIGGTVSTAGSFAQLATIAPGESAGVLTVGNVEFGDFSQLLIEISGNNLGDWDILNVLGDLSISSNGTRISFVIPEALTLTLSEYQIVALTDTASATGVFSWVDAVLGYEIDYRFGDVEDRGIFLTRAVAPVPLPIGAWVGVSGIATLALLGRARRGTA